MQKTKPIYKPYRHADRRCQDLPYQNGFNYSISPLLHQQLIFSILNYQSTENQQKVSFTMQDFLRNLYADYYSHYDQPDPENLQEDRIKKSHSLQQINLQYSRKIQQFDTGRVQSMPRVSFSEEATVKYYRKEDAASELANYEEYCFSPFDQNDNYIHITSDS